MRRCDIGWWVYEMKYVFIELGERTCYNETEKKDMLGIMIMFCFFIDSYYNKYF